MHAPEKDGKAGEMKTKTKFKNRGIEIAKMFDSYSSNSNLEYRKKGGKNKGGDAYVNKSK